MYNNKPVCCTKLNDLTEKQIRQ